MAGVKAPTKALSRRRTSFLDEDEEEDPLS
jgi:hypothetical protein